MIVPRVFRRADAPPGAAIRRSHGSRRRLSLEELENRIVPSTLTVDGSQHFQTIYGFGTNLSSEAWNSGAVTPSLDLLLNHGYQLYRVILEPVQGWEDTNPNTGSYSDTNPNWPYYNNLYGTSTKFTNLWNTINYLHDRGATVWLNLQSDAPAWMTDSGGASGSLGQDHEADWATMVSTMVDYAINVAHVHLDALGPMNEPDNPGDPVQGPQVGATQYVRMLDLLETQLQGYGLGNVPLVGPDTASAGNAVDQYVPAMLADSLLMPHILQFGFHTYGGSVSDPDVTGNITYPGRQIVSDEYDGPYYNEDHGERATPAELWAQADASFQNLLAMVGAGENGATIWDGVDNFYLYYDQWSAHGLVSYDWTAVNPTAPSDYGTTARLYANAMLFQFAGAGSVVLGASDDASNFLEAALENPGTGQLTIVGENLAGTAQTLNGNLTGGLSASLFNFYYTNASLDMQQQANVPVSGNTFTFTVPADTIFTLTTPTAPSVTGVTPISGLASGGQTVTIAGSNFSGATGVFFGGMAASSFTINSDSKITAITPAQAAGAVDVTVANPNRRSAISPVDQFQYAAVNGTAPPTVSTPASAALAANQFTGTLAVLGASQYGASTLTYTWATLGTPPAPVAFNTNGNNQASNTTCTFAAAGTYTFQATITDPAGNSVTSTVSVTVTVMLATLTVSPGSGSVLPYGSLQFNAVSDDQFGNPYVGPIGWSVNGGGTIDASGKFTAGSFVGGPFAVTASVGSARASGAVTIVSAVNVAPSGTAYRWFGMSSATATTNQTAAPGLNDNDLGTDVTLSGGGDDLPNAYEAAGVLWATPQALTQVTFTNGSFNASSFDGVFDNNFGLQTTTDGVTWSPLGAWSLSPAYPYNMPAAAGQTYTFTGPAVTLLGVRVVGQVHSLSGNDSWFVNATEVQAFGSPSPGPLGQYLVRATSSTIAAGKGLLITVQAADGQGNPVTTYSGPASVTASLSPGSAASNFPVTVPINSHGLGFFLANLQKVGVYTITVAGGSFLGSLPSPVAVLPGPPVSLAFAAQPASTPTGVPLMPVTVQVLDHYGNVVTTDQTDLVTLSVASTGVPGFTPASTTTATVHNGVATFNNLTLVAPGSYTLSAVVAGSYTGPYSTPFTITPLQVVPGSFAGTPSGFSLQFNAPYLVNATTPVLYGAGALVPSLTLTQTGDAQGHAIVPVPIAGSLLLDAANNRLRFLATNTSLAVNNGSPILPDGTYTVVLHSSAATTGLQAASSGGGFLDGLGTGAAGSGDFVTTFVVNAAATGADILWVPDTADGPGQALNAPGQNRAGGGYPIYLLDHTAGVTQVQVTLNYNPALLTVTGVTGAGFTLLAASAPGQAVLQYSGPALPAGSQTPIGFLIASVPGGTTANPIPYGGEDLLHLSAVSLNGGAVPVVTSDGLHLVTYVGDADANGSYSSNDAVLITRASLQADAGFSAYPRVDPVIVADTDGAGFIPADAALQVAEAGVGFPTANLPDPPIPSGVHFRPALRTGLPRWRH
jgi:O-glycosyl hydrolase